jgi:hypothetical protein
MGTGDKPRKSLESILVLGSSEGPEAEKLKRGISTSVFQDAGREIDVAYFKDGRNFFKGTTSRLRKASEQGIDAKLLFVVPIDSPDVEKVLSLYTADDPKYSRLKEVPMVVVGDFENAAANVQKMIRDVGKTAKVAASYSEVGQTISSLKVFTPEAQNPTAAEQFDDDEITGVHTPGKPEPATGAAATSAPAEHDLPALVIEPSRPERVLRPQATGQYTLEPRTRRALVYAQNKDVEQQFSRHLRKQHGEGSIILPGFKVYFATDEPVSRMSIGNAWKLQEYRNSVLNWFTREGMFDQTFLLAPDAASRIDNLVGIVDLLDSSEEIPSTKIAAVIPTTMHIPDFQKLGQTELSRKIKLYANMDELVREMQDSARRQVEDAAKRGSMIDIAEELFFPHETFLTAGDRTQIDTSKTQNQEERPAVISQTAPVAPVLPEAKMQNAISAEYTVIGESQAGQASAQPLQRVETVGIRAPPVIVPSESSRRPDEARVDMEIELMPVDEPEATDELSPAEVVMLPPPIPAALAEQRVKRPTPPPIPVHVIEARVTRPTPPPIPREAIAIAERNGSVRDASNRRQGLLMLPQRTENADDFLAGVTAQGAWLTKVDDIIRTNITEPIPGSVHEVLSSVVKKCKPEDAAAVAGAIGSAISSLKDATPDAKVNYLGLLDVMGNPSVPLPAAEDMIEVLALELPDFVRGRKAIPYGYWERTLRNAAGNIEHGGLEIITEAPKRLLETPELQKKDYLALLENLSSSDLQNAMAATSEIFRIMNSLIPDEIRPLYISGVNHLEYSPAGLSAAAGRDGRRMVESAKGIHNMLAGVKETDARNLGRLTSRYDPTSQDAIHVAVLYALQAINRSPATSLDAQSNFFELLGMLSYNDSISPDTMREKILSLPDVVAHPQVSYDDVKSFVRIGYSMLSKGGQEMVDKCVDIVRNTPARGRKPLSEIIAGVANREMSLHTGDITKAIAVAESLHQLESEMEGTHVRDRYLAAVREKAEKAGFSPERAATIGKDAYYHLLFEEIMLGFGEEFGAANRNKYAALPNRFQNGERVAIKKAILESTEAMLKGTPENPSLSLERYLDLLSLTKIKPAREGDAERAARMAGRLAELVRSATEFCYYDELYETLALSLAAFDNGGERIIYNWPNLMPLNSSESNTPIFSPPVIRLLTGLCREHLPQAFETVQSVVAKSHALQDDVRKGMYLSGIDALCAGEKPSVSGVLSSSDEIFKRIYTLSEEQVAGIGSLLSKYEEPYRSELKFPILKALSQLTQEEARNKYLDAIRIMGSEASSLHSPEDAASLIEYLRELLVGNATVKYEDVEGLVAPALLLSPYIAGLALLKAGEDIVTRYGKEHPLNKILANTASNEPEKAVTITSEVIECARRLEDAANEQSYFEELITECSSNGKSGWTEESVRGSSSEIVDKHNWFITRQNAENYARLSNRLNESEKDQLLNATAEGVGVFCPKDKASEPEPKAARDKYLKLIGTIADNEKIAADDIFRLLRETLPRLMSGNAGDYTKMHTTVESLIMQYHNGGKELLAEWMPLANAYGDGCSDGLSSIIEGLAANSGPKEALSAAKKIIYNVSQVNDEDNRKAYLAEIISISRTNWDLKTVLKIADTELQKYKFFESEPENPEKALLPLQPAGLLPEAAQSTNTDNQDQNHVSGGSNMTEPNNESPTTGGAVTQPGFQPTTGDSSGAQAAPSAVAGVIVQPAQQPTVTGQPAPNVSVSVNVSPGAVPAGAPAAAPAQSTSGAYTGQPATPVSQPDPGQTTQIIDSPKKNKTGLVLTLLGIAGLVGAGGYLAYRAVKADEWQTAAHNRYESETTKMGNLPDEIRKGLHEKYKVEWSSWNTEGDVAGFRKEADAYDRYAKLFGKDKAIQSFKRGDSIDSVIKQVEEESSRRSAVASAGTKPDAGQGASSRPAYAATQPAEQPASKPSEIPASKPAVAKTEAPVETPKRQYTERKIEYSPEAGKKPTPSGRKGHRRWMVRSPAYDSAEEANTPSLDGYVIPASRLRQESETPYNRGRSGNRGGIY